MDIVMKNFFILLFLSVLYASGTSIDVDSKSNLDRMLRSIDTTCASIHSLLTYQRKIVNISVTREAPVRIKIDMELTAQSTPSIKHYFSVEGMICQHGFNRNAAQAACYSQKKKLQMFSTNYEWEPSTDSLHDKCYFAYNGDPFVVPCDFVLDNFNCSSSATSLNECNYTPLFQHSCTRDMHVGISCSGTCKLGNFKFIF